MQLETKEVESGFVRLLADLMYNRLSHDKNGRTNVIRGYPSDNSNDKGLKPDLPFMTVHCMASTTPYGWLLDKFVDDDNFINYVIAFRVPVMLTAYGKGAHSIITEVKQRFEWDSTRDYIEKETGARLLDSGDLPNNYDYMNTDFENSAPLIVEIVLNSVLKDTSGSGVIEEIIVDGQLKYTYDQIPAEYEIHLDVNDK